MSKFEELRDKRLPVALSKISLLGNLGRPHYRATDIEKRTVVAQLRDAVDKLAVAYKCSVVHDYVEAAPQAENETPLPSGKADGGASFESEVRWAIDAIRRGEPKLAEARLKLILKGEI